MEIKGIIYQLGYLCSIFLPSVILCFCFKYNTNKKLSENDIQCSELNLLEIMKSGYIKCVAIMELTSSKGGFCV